MKTVKVLLVIFIIILIIGIIFPSLIEMLIIKGTYSNNLDQINSDLPLNRNLSRAIAGILGICTYYNYRYLFSFDQRKRNLGVFFFALSFVSYPLLVYSIINVNGYYFSGKGEPLVCCAEKLGGGYEKVDCDLKVHPVYGTKVCDCTPDMIRSIEGINIPAIDRLAITRETRFFTNDGFPLAWYYENESGQLEFFTHPGVHPQFATELLPVTKEIAAKALMHIGQRDQTKSGLYNPSSENGGTAQVLYTIGKKSQIKIPSRENYKAYINVGSTNKGGVSVVILDESGYISNSVSNTIADIYTKSGRNGSIGLFKSSFVQTPEFSDLTSGGSEIIEKMDLSNYADYIAIGKLKFSNAEGNLVKGTIVCTASITMNIISTDQKSLVRSFVIKDIRGNGADRVQAQEIAFRKLLDSFSENYTQL